MKEEIRIGFLGGCISNQTTIPRNRHYYSLLYNSLRTALHGKEITILLDSYNSFGELEGKARSVLEKKSPGIFVIFIRPFPLLQMCRPWIKYMLEEKKTSRALHPAIFHPFNSGWPTRFTEHFTEGPFISRSRMKLNLSEMNLLAGKILGLNRWCSEAIIKEIGRINSFLEKENKTLFVISPPRYIPSRIGNHICRSSNARIGKACKEKSIGYINIYDDRDELFDDDGVHFNEKGHAFLANELFDVLNPVLI